MLYTVQDVELVVFPRLGVIRGLAYLHAYTEWRLKMLEPLRDDHDDEIRDETVAAYEQIRLQPPYEF